MNRKKILCIGVAIVALSAFALWLTWRLPSHSISTDNAYVHADITSIAPKVAGYISEMHIGDNAPVKAGDLLFVVDERDYRAKLRQSEANVHSAEAAVANANAAIRLQSAIIRQAEAQVASATATQKRAAQEYARQSRLRREKATTEQKFEDSARDNAQMAAILAGAQANLDVQTRQIDVLAAQAASAQAGLSQAQAAYSLSTLDLEHCRVYAPVDGVIGNRKVRVGRYVTPGTGLLDLVPVRDVWIVANFKETQLERIRVGLKVRITVDGYPDTPLEGVIDGLAPGSGSAFSLLPPDNATGNFVRVVQRVPVKIALSENSLEGLLVPGISARVTVLLDSEK